MNELEELKAYLALREELTNTDFENIHIISTTEGNATLRASTILDLISRLEKAERDKAILNGALSSACGERDEAYSEIDGLTKQNNELFDDIEKIASANADLAGWSRAKDERISELEAALRLIRRGPVKPLPDPGAHSWRAFAEAVFAAMRDNQRTASRALGGDNHE